MTLTRVAGRLEAERVLLDFVFVVRLTLALLALDDSALVVRRLVLEDQTVVDALPKLWSRVLEDARAELFYRLRLAALVATLGAAQRVAEHALGELLVRLISRLGVAAAVAALFRVRIDAARLFRLYAGVVYL